MNARGHLSAETIDLLSLSALDPQATQVAQTHLDGCAACRSRWDELQVDSQRFKQFVYPRTVGEVTSRVLRPSFFDRLRLSGVRVLGPALGAAAAAGLVLVVALGKGGGTQTEDDVYVGLKGGPGFTVVAQRATGGQLEVGAGTVLHPGDKVRFVTQPAGQAYVLVVGKDSRGAVQVYHPLGGSESVAATSGELPQSFELDDALGEERLWAVYSAQPLQAAQVGEALERGETIQGARVVAVTYRKEAAAP